MLVEIDFRWLINDRLNLVNEGEHEQRSERFNTSAGGRGSWRGKHKSWRAADRGETCPTGSQAAGTIGKIKRVVVREVNLSDVETFVVVIDTVCDTSDQILFEPLIDVHVDEKLDVVRFVRSWESIMILSISTDKKRSKLI